MKFRIQVRFCIMYIFCGKLVTYAKKLRTFEICTLRWSSMVISFCCHEVSFNGSLKFGRLCHGAVVAAPKGRPVWHKVGCKRQWGGVMGQSGAKLAPEGDLYPPWLIRKLGKHTRKMGCGWPGYQHLNVLIINHEWWEFGWNVVRKSGAKGVDNVANMSVD